MCRLRPSRGPGRLLVLQRRCALPALPRRPRREVAARAHRLHGRPGAGGVHRTPRSRAVSDVGRDGGGPPLRRIPPGSVLDLAGGAGVTLDLSGIDLERVPRHVGLILDGNGRWANARGLPRTAGHLAGEAALFDTVEGALELGIEWLTAFTFSTENWS